MQSRRIARGITALVFGFALALVIHSMEARWVANGLDAYLVHQTMRFEKMPHSVIPLGIIYSVTALFALWVYEAAAWLIAKAMKQP
jgi:hypothetical protein